jgi:BNR repeat-like domain
MARTSSLSLWLSTPLLCLSAALGQVPLTQLSTDTFTNSGSQHATEVEPDIYAYGSTLVATFQVGRVFSGGCADIGWATSTDGGVTWTNGYLPGLTQQQNPANPFQYISDPAVAYDAKDGVWMIASLPVSGGRTPAVAVNRSTDGGLTWQNPVFIQYSGTSDKSWITCDNGPSSPYSGHCYVEWDDPNAAGLIRMSTSTDGGQTWGPALAAANNARGVGGQPLVQPNGTVLVPIATFNESGIISISSSDGGSSWNAAVKVAGVKQHRDPGGIRSGALPSATIDMNGKVYVTWEDCRFRSGCTANDIVMSTSTDGQTWTRPVRIPIDSVTSTVDHFIPGIAADPRTAGSSAHLGLTYYYYPQASCSASTCQLDVGYVYSRNGGASWAAPTQLAGPMMISWLPSTSGGRMVGDYIATAFSRGRAYGVFAVANANSGSTFDEAIYTTAMGLIGEDDAITEQTGFEPVALTTPTDQVRQPAPVVVH